MFLNKWNWWPPRTIILGESGAGKELVARETHKRSNRHDRPLIKLSDSIIGFSNVLKSLFFLVRFSTIVLQLAAEVVELKRTASRFLQPSPGIQFQ